MQVVSECHHHQVEMQRDNDLIRELLISIEQNPQLDGSTWMTLDNSDAPGHSAEEISYHALLLIEAGFVRGNIAGPAPMISRLTWEGHEFLDNVKDVGVWEKTKERLKGIPGVALTVVAAIAEAEIKKKLGLK